MPADMLACRDHWFQVPSEVRRRIWWLWRKRNLPELSESERERVQAQHLAACGDAVTHMRVVT